MCGFTWARRPLLTITGLDGCLSRALRIRASAHDRSMEEEAGQILRDALRAQPDVPVDMVTRLHAWFARLGDMQLRTAPREPLDERPVDAEAEVAGGAKPARLRNAMPRP